LLSYEIAGSILTLRASDSSTASQRKHLLAAVRADPLVPEAALLLLDWSQAPGPNSRAATILRLYLLMDHLGSKLGPLCAMLVTVDMAERAEVYQQVAGRAGLLVRIFIDESEARRWLAS
jgi:hypothetical protein